MRFAAQISCFYYGGMGSFFLAPRRQAENPEQSTTYTLMLSLQSKGTVSTNRRTSDNGRFQSERESQWETPNG